MGKKKLYSEYSKVKLAEAITGNVAGRLGGLLGLDRDIQLQLEGYGRGKADYWHSKFSVYHQLRAGVADVIRSTNPNVPNYLYGLAYAYAQKVARLYAMYPTDVADQYLNAVKAEFSDLIGILGDETVGRIDALAREAGMKLYGMYRLGGQPPTGGGGGAPA